jgi:hypothetical protein
VNKEEHVVFEGADAVHSTATLSQLLGGTSGKDKDQLHAPTWEYTKLLCEKGIDKASVRLGTM